MITSAIAMHTCAIALLVGILCTLNKRTETRVVTKLSAKQIESQMDLNANMTNISLEIELDYSDNKEKQYFCSLKYLILHLNMILYCFGQSVIYTHIASYAHHKGHELVDSSYLISIIGISNVIGRILLGLVAQHPFVNITLLYASCYILSGVCCYGYCLWTSYVTMASLMALLGFTLAAFGPLLSEIVCTTVGVNNFASAYGYLLISMAFGTLLGAPSAGWMFDVTQVYELSFILGGTTLILSGVIMGIPKLADICRNIFYS